MKEKLSTRIITGAIMAAFVLLAIALVVLGIAYEIGKVLAVWKYLTS